MHARDGGGNLHRRSLATARNRFEYSFLTRHTNEFWQWKSTGLCEMRCIFFARLSFACLALSDRLWFPFSNLSVSFQTSWTALWQVLTGNKSISLTTNLAVNPDFFHYWVLTDLIGWRMCWLPPEVLACTVHQYHCGHFPFSLSEVVSTMWELPFTEGFRLAQPLGRWGSVTIDPFFEAISAALVLHSYVTLTSMSYLQQSKPECVCITIQLKHAAKDTHWAG